VAAVVVVAVEALVFWLDEEAALVAAVAAGSSIFRPVRVGGWERWGGNEERDGIQ